MYLLYVAMFLLFFGCVIAVLAVGTRDLDEPISRDSIQFARLLLISGAIFAVLAGIIVISGCASSTSGKVLNGAVIGSAVADMHSTRAVIDSGAGLEGNPLMSQSLTQQALVKALGTSAVIAGAFLLQEKGHPVWAHIIRGVAITAWSVAAASNYRLARGTR